MPHPNHANDTHRHSGYLEKDDLIQLCFRAYKEDAVMCKMRRILFFISFLLLVFSSFRAVSAQGLAPATITDVVVTTIDGKSVKDTPLMTGATYRVIFTIEVAAGLKEQAVLKTSLIRAPNSDRFWTLKGDYAGIDATSWQPGQSTLSFDAVPGTAQLELEGSVPEEFVTETLSTGEVLHISKEIGLLELSMESGAVVSDFKLEVIDSSIEEYRSILDEKKQLIENMDADPAYASLVDALVASADAQASIGYTDFALETLEAIPDSGWVAPRTSSSYQWIIVGVLAVIAAALAFLLIQARNEAGFIKRQTDSQAKRLQILALKASRIGDSNLTEGIEQVRKELQQSAGGS